MTIINANIITNSVTTLKDNAGISPLQLKIDFRDQATSLLLSIQNKPGNWLMSWFKSFNWTELTFKNALGKQETVLVNIESAVKELGIFGDVRGAIAKEKFSDFIQNAQQDQNQKELLGWKAELQKSAPHLDSYSVNTLVAYAVENQNTHLLRHPANRNLPRTMEFTPDGKILVHLTRSSRINRDPIMGRGGEKIVKEAIDLKTGEKFASGRLFNAQAYPSESENLKIVQGNPRFSQLISEQSYQSPKHKNVQRIVTKFCNAGNLAQACLAQRLTPEDKKYIFEELVEGIAELHRMGYMHLDIKPANIFLHKENGKIRPVIGDFGFMTPISDKLADSGTEIYCPPELFNSGQSPVIVNPAFDVWALGCTLYELLNDEALKWNTVDAYEHYINGLGINFYQIPEPAERKSPDYFVWLMLQVDPDERASSKELKERLKDIDWALL